MQPLSLKRFSGMNLGVATYCHIKNNRILINGKLEFETPKESENTLKFAKRLLRKGLLDFIATSITVPYPGSRLYDIAEK